MAKNRERSETTRRSASFKLRSRESVILVDSVTGEKVIVVAGGNSEVLDLRFSPSGRKLAAYFADGDTRIWDAGPGYRYAESDEFRIGVLRQQADQLLKAKDYAGAVPLLRELLALRPSDSGLISQLLHCHTQLDDVESLARDYRRFFETLDEPSYGYLHWAALIQLASGQSDEFRATCQTMLAQLDSDATEADRMCTVWASALAPDAVDDYTTVVEMARGLVTDEPENTAYQQYLGAILLRAGKPDEAAPYLRNVVEGAVERSSPTYGMYFLSMANHQLGDVEQAREWLAKANEASDKELAVDTVAWNRKLTLELLRAEATELISPEQ